MFITKNIETYNTVAITIFLLGCMGLVSVIVFDKLYWSTDVFSEGWPDFSLGYLIRSFVIFTSILAIFWSLIGNSKPSLILDRSNEVPFERLSILGALSLSVIFLFLFIFLSSLFSRLSLEDGPVEWGSALFLFGSSIVIAIAFLKSRNALKMQKVTHLSLAFLSFVFFFVAMEEISWFERVLEIEVPNVQREINIHNFATSYFENAYYSGTFLFLVFLPFARFLFPFVSNNEYLRIFVPRPFVGIIGSIACAYNFDMWNIIFTQIAFFSCLVILLAFAVFSSKRIERYIILSALFIVVTTQVLFLAYGENFVRLWEVTEYKELFIPLAFFIYSLDVLSYINREYLPEKS